MRKHTPGPWSIKQPKRILGCDTRGQLYLHAKDVTLAAILDGEREANACLIAAAPDLLQVAEAIEGALRMPGVTAAEVLDENSPIRDALRAAVSKAKGGA